MFALSHARSHDEGDVYEYFPAVGKDEAGIVIFIPSCVGRRLSLLRWLTAPFVSVIHHGAAQNLGLRTCTWPFSLSRTITEECSERDS